MSEATQSVALGCTSREVSKQREWVSFRFETVFAGFRPRSLAAESCVVGPGWALASPPFPSHALRGGLRPPPAAPGTSRCCSFSPRFPARARAAQRSKLAASRAGRAAQMCRGRTCSKASGKAAPPGRPRQGAPPAPRPRYLFKASAIPAPWLGRFVMVQGCGASCLQSDVMLPWKPEMKHLSIHRRITTCGISQNN